MDRLEDGERWQVFSVRDQNPSRTVTGMFRQAGGLNEDSEVEPEHSRPYASMNHFALL
jgi:hypothetical protein